MTAIEPHHAVCALTESSTSTEATTVPPELMFADWSRLVAVRQSSQSDTYDRAIDRLRRDVAAVAAEGPWTVTSKTAIPPSGDSRDYCSWSEYFWPDPNQPDGLPWVLRDGHINPATKTGSQNADHLRMMANGAHAASLLAWLCDDEHAAELASLVIERWFLDQDTGMRPNLRYASLIPGIDEPPSWGLIRAHPLLRVIDATRLLRDIGRWPAEHDRALQAWWGDFLEWMLGSPVWNAELERGNNHTTWCLALGLGLATELQQGQLVAELSARVPDVIDAQVTINGEQPAEAARSRGYFYSCYNLEGLALLNDLSRPCLGDAWALDAPAGARLRAALVWLSPYLHRPDRWPSPFLIDWDATVGATTMHRIVARCRDLSLGDAFRAAPHLSRPGLREWLTWDTGTRPTVVTT